jgi:hypothetical protein
VLLPDFLSKQSNLPLAEARARAQKTFDPSTDFSMLVKKKRIANSVAAALTITFSSVVVVIAILCAYNTETISRLEMPVPLNVGRKDLLKLSTSDYGYFSADPSTRAYSEIHRALGNSAANSTFVPELPGNVVESPNATLNTAEPIHEVSVFDRVSLHLLPIAA